MHMLLKLNSNIDKKNIYKPILYILGTHIQLQNDTSIYQVACLETFNITLFVLLEIEAYIVQ